MGPPRAPGAQYMGLNWVGPAIMAFGTEEQKRQHLAAIAAGEVIWCQGFSEPEAGSDLASLRTRAAEDGDGWRINGQKIWTSYAGMAQWCVLAARVGQGERHEGITMFLVPMDTPGITVRPIRSMLGPHHLNEVFFDEVWAGPTPCSAGSARAGRDPQGAGPRAGRHRPLRPLRAAALRARPRARRRTGTTCPRRCTPSGLGRSCRCGWPACSPTGPCTPRPRASCPTCWPRAARIAVTQCDQAVAEVLFQALEDEALEAGPGARCTARSRTTGATPRRPPWPRARSRSSG